MFSLIKNFFSKNQYKNHDEAVIVSCFFNPQNNPYRLLAFFKWYNSIKHLNHRIIECTINDGKSQLPDSPYITKIHSDSVLWHKESLINKVVKDLPEKFKYVFWVDADILFTNNNWLVDGVKQLQLNKIIQPFEYCVHLGKNELKPSFDLAEAKENIFKQTERRLWRSFCSNVYKCNPDCNSENYDVHGHVGFAWGARREVLEECPLYDKALVGGADHIIAHAAAGQIPHKCITKSFYDDIDGVNSWSHKFYQVIGGKDYMGYVKGDVYHIWHGDIKKREYLKRIKDFTLEAKEIKDKDKNGLYKATGKDKYVDNYFKKREVQRITLRDMNSFGITDALFFTTMGYYLHASHDVDSQRHQDSYDETTRVDEVLPDENQPLDVELNESENFS